MTSTRRDLVLDLTGSWFEDSWVPVAISGVLPVIATLFVTFGQALEDRGDWAWILGGSVLLLVVVGIQVASHQLRKRLRGQELSEVDRLRVAMKDALQRVAELIAAMPSKGKSERKAELKRVASQSLGAIQLLLDNVDRLRVVVYQIVDQSGRMEYLDYGGRSGTPPQPFVPGTPRGDLAIKMVRDGGDKFAPDIEREPPEHYQGSAKGYRTFISASITNGEYAYGMVTVDAPNAGDLVDTDKQIVMLVADLLAIAFAEAER
ncbi:hypothetical protein [Rhodococcus pyridinivorans]